MGLELAFQSIKSAGNFVFIATEKSRITLNLNVTEVLLDSAAKDYSVGKH